MSGSLNPRIILEFKERFEQDCITLLLESYNSISSKSALKEEDENDITVRLIGVIQSHPKRTELNISVDRESYYDSLATYAGLVSADKSPRIDMRWTVWGFNTEFKYYIEAKNLSENNWNKSSGAFVNAKALQERYIDTGIGNFMTGRYPHGCLIGYITEGVAGSIANKINILLSLNGRTTENLIKQADVLSVPHYTTTHTGSGTTLLKHFFLTFT